MPVTNMSALHIAAAAAGCDTAGMLLLQLLPSGRCSPQPALSAAAAAAAGMPPRLLPALLPFLARIDDSKQP